MSKQIKNSVTIENNVVRKKYNEEVIKLFDYFETVNFDNYPKIINKTDEYIETEYIDSTIYHEMTKGVELIKTLSSLHSKTLFFKEISKNKYKKIYDNLYGNIKYLQEFYLNLIENAELEIYNSPSNYLFMKNYSVIDSSLNYALNELKKWYKSVQNSTKERVCIVHNNVCLDHFIKNKKNYLISWDKHLVDTPILDLYIFYKKEGYSLDFNYLLKVYEETLPLTKEEKILLNVLISLPPKLDIIEDEYLNTINVNNLINYVCSGINIVNENK